MAREARLQKFADFVEYTKLNPDQLLDEGKESMNLVGKRLNNYFTEYAKKVSWNTAVTRISYIRGFYTHNDLHFPKKYGVPKRKSSAVSKRDTKTEIYGYDEEKNETTFNNGLLQQFVQNLNFRDQTIVLCLLSTGADATDLLKLNMGFVKDGKGKVSSAKRLMWLGDREKTGNQFKTYFSEEATEFLRRYVEQTRSGASDDEPLFATDDGGRMDAHLLSMNFRLASKKMGYTKEKQANPFRPKRFRHLFRTACSNAKIDNGYIEAFMGHSSTVSAGYLETGNGLLLKEYLKAESYLTVFGVNTAKVTELGGEITELKVGLGEVTMKERENTEKITALEQKNNSLEQKNLELEKTVKNIYSFVHQNLDPVLDTFNALVQTPEGKAALDKLKSKTKD